MKNMLIKTTKAVTTYPEGQQAIKEASEATAEGFVLTGIIMNPKDLALYNKAAYSFSMLSIDEKPAVPGVFLHSSRGIVEGAWVLIYAKEAD